MVKMGVPELDFCKNYSMHPVKLTLVIIKTESNVIKGLNGIGFAFHVNFFRMDNGGLSTLF